LRSVFTEYYLVTASDCSCSHRRTNGRRTFSIFLQIACPGQLLIESEHTECNSVAVQFSSVAVLGKIFGEGAGRWPLVI